MDRYHSAYVVNALSGISASLEKLNLSRRDMLAGMALQGYIGRNVAQCFIPLNNDEMVSKSVEMADALIAELDKPKEKN